MPETIFCYLEKDDKTWAYFRTYAASIAEGTDLYRLDLKVQADDLRAHLERRYIADPAAASDEKRRWIETNGAPFRKYLNTLKVLVLLRQLREDDAAADGTTLAPCEYPEFAALVDWYNRHKPRLLDAIYERDGRPDALPDAC